MGRTHYPLDLFRPKETPLNAEEMLGREMLARQNLLVEYRRLLSLLGDVCSGKTDPKRVVVALAEERCIPRRCFVLRRGGGMTREEIRALLAGREMDRLIAAMLGDREEDGWWFSGFVAGNSDTVKYSDEDGGPRRYSAKIEAAFSAVDALSARFCWLILEDWRNIPNAPGKWAALFDFHDGHDTGHALGETAAEAICRACLLAATTLKLQP